MKPTGTDLLNLFVEDLKKGGGELDVPPAPPAAPQLPPPLPLPTTEKGTWLSPDYAEVTHGQVWVIKSAGGAIVWGQMDGYDVDRGRRYWRAINLLTRRTIHVLRVLEGSCPRIGGRRGRARR